MRAFKFLKQGGIGPFSGYRWPRPEGGAPSAWIGGDGPVQVCFAGVHACAAEDLSYWIERELWVVELGGELRREPKKLVAPRGRLLRRVEAWTPEAARALTDACVLRARDVACEVLRAEGRADVATELAACEDADAIARVAAARAGEEGARVLGYVADTVTFSLQDTATCAYVAAHVRLTEDGYAAERVWQSRWLVERLGLSADGAERGSSA